jgi:glycosyltransferase involved in cell wall biosynthesis
MANNFSDLSAAKLSSNDLKVALVYDWVDTKYGGAEQVVLALHNLFPQAELFTSVYNPQKANWADQFQVKTSFLNRLPLVKNHHRLALPLLPIAFESLNLSKFDLIISVTSALAKGIITRADQLHLCYLLSPPRFLYDFDQEFVEYTKFSRLPVIKQFSKLMLDYIRWWDQAAMFRPDVIVPISKLVQKRVGKKYGLKTSAPIYPPVDMIDLQTDDQALAKMNLPKDFCLVVSRLISYKKIDLAIQACAKLGKNLIIVGDGPSKKAWQKLAESLKSTSGSQIVFLPSQPQPIVNSLMKNARLFLSPGVDDFGLSPLQANLFSTAAIINADSGVAEVFKNNAQGLMLKTATTSNLISIIQQALSQNFNSAKMKQLAQSQNTDKFLKEIANIIQLAKLSTIKK